jgi:3'-phosphoadenosine 5'-phosphosulfate (PAPS) 3'-phosphatase
VEAFVKQRIQSAFPEDGFLGEESGARLPDAQQHLRVGQAGAALFAEKAILRKRALNTLFHKGLHPPIDGTSCFLNGLHTWCLSLAIVADGEPVIGVVYDTTPMTGSPSATIASDRHQVCRPLRKQLVPSMGSRPAGRGQRGR